MATTYYLNPDKAANGDGLSPATAFNSFATPDTWTKAGGFDGSKLLLNSDARNPLYDTANVFNKVVTGDGPDGIILGAYGDGALPIIDGSVVATSLWIQDDTTVWFTDDTTAAPILDGAMLRQFSTEAGMRNNEGTYWISGSRVYINFPDDPNRVPQRVPGFGPLINGGGGSLSHAIRDVHLRWSQFEQIRFAGEFSGLVIASVLSGPNDNSLSGATKQFASLAGTSVIAPVTGIRVLYNRVYGNFGAGTHHGVETRFMDGAVLDGNRFEHVETTVFEFWQSMINSIIRNNVAIECGQFWWLSPGPGTDNNHQNNQCYNNEWTGFFFPDDGPGREQSQSALKIDSGSGNSAYNNTFVGEGSAVIRQTILGGGDNTFTLKNNVIVNLDVGTKNVVHTTNSASPIAFNADYNQYYVPNGNSAWASSLGTVTSLAAWKTNGGGADELEGDPGLTNLSRVAPDFAPTAGAAVLEAGLVEAATPDDDRFGRRRIEFTASRTDIGAQQRQRIVPNATSISTG